MESVKGLWSDIHQSEHINVLEIRAVLLALIHFQTLIARFMLLIAADNTTVLAYIEKQSGIHSFLLCALAWEIWMLCHKLQVSLFVRHIPSRLDVIVNALSRQNQQTNTEWQLHPPVLEPFAIDGIIRMSIYLQHI